MEDDPLADWTGEDEAAFQEYLKTHPELRPMAPWKATRLVRLLLPATEADVLAFAKAYAEAEDDLLRAILR